VTVLVVPPPSGAEPGPVEQAVATVVAVEAADTTGTSTVSLLLESASGLRIAGARGDVALVVVAPGGAA
jgi:hypothetical protein